MEPRTAVLCVFGWGRGCGFRQVGGDAWLDGAFWFWVDGLATTVRSIQRHLIEKWDGRRCGEQIMHSPSLAMAVSVTFLS